MMLTSVNSGAAQDLMFHTLDKEELNLSIGPMALSVAEVGDFTRDYGTYIGDIKVAIRDTTGLWLGNTL